MSKPILIALFLLLFYSFELGTAQTLDNQAREEIDGFFREIISGERDKKILSDFSALKKQLPYPENELLEQLLVSVLSSQSSIEFLLKKHAWITAAKEQPLEAAVSSAIMLSEAGEEIRVKTLTSMMLDSDYPPNPGVDWNLDKYWPIFKATEEEPFHRLVVYAFDAAPSKALEMMIELYGESIPVKEQQNIVWKAEEIALNLRRHSQLFGKDENVERVVEFFVELTEYDEWFLDLFIAVCLKKDRLQNVSPKLNDYFNSKPEGLAGKLRAGINIASLPKQKLSIDDIMNASQRTSKDIRRQQDFSAQIKNNRAASKIEKEKLSKYDSTSFSWIYWALGVLILGGVGVLVWSSSKGSSAR